MAIVKLILIIAALVLAVFAFVGFSFLDLSAVKELALGVGSLAVALLLP